MEKSEQVLLQECQKELEALKARLAALEQRIASLQEQEHLTRPEEEVDFTGVELGVSEAPAQPEPGPAPAPVAEPEPVPEPAPKPVVSSAEIHYMWQTDKPGILVKNIRSGISLLDRAQFIGTLFKEDFALYDATIAELNQMESMDQAIAYVQSHFPQWNLGSDVAYRFMMAIRKKLG